MKQELKLQRAGNGMIQAVIKFFADAMPPIVIASAPEKDTEVARKRFNLLFQIAQFNAGSELDGAAAMLEHLRSEWTRKMLACGLAGKLVPVRRLAPSASGKAVRVQARAYPEDAEPRDFRFYVPNQVLETGEKRGEYFVPLHFAKSKAEEAGYSPGVVFDGASAERSAAKLGAGLQVEPQASQADLHA